MKNFWRAIENISRWEAVTSSWRDELGEDYAGAQAGFLRASGRGAPAYPCPHECGCHHELYEQEDGGFVGVCQCDPFDCDDLRLTAEEIEIHELNLAKVGRAVVRALGCEPRAVDLGVRGIWQVGLFSGAALPVVLAVPINSADFANAMAQLVCRLRERFIVLAPTCRYVNGNALGLLANAKAGFFNLETHVALAPSGILTARQSGGELFSRYLPEIQSEVQENEAAKVMAIVSKLRSERGRQKAPLFDVFNYLVVDGLTQREAAQECGCASGLMALRAKELQQRFQMSVERLRAFASDVRERETSIRGDAYRRKNAGAMVSVHDSGEEKEI